MARIEGSVNADHDEKRLALARRALKAWTREGTGTSMRALARACDVSVPTLTHYFKDRAGLFEAVMEQALADGRAHMDAAARLGADESAEQALGRLLEYIAFGWRQGELRVLHELGMGEGMGAPARGASYVRHVLEPTFESGERLIAALVAAQELPPMDVRAASLTLLSPLLMGLLHQDTLCGAEHRELDVGAFIGEHVVRWVAGHATPTAQVTAEP